jgi:superfamily II DNA or RNA helicase
VRAICHFETSFYKLKFQGGIKLNFKDFLDLNQCRMNEIEKDFVELVFFPYAGENGLDYLKVQTPFEDSLLKKRKLDFTIETNNYKYVIEIDGYTYHAEGAQRVSPDYFDDLLVKQNDLILNGWKLLRFSYNQVRTDSIICIDTLRRAFKSDPEINPIFVGRGELVPTYPQKQALESVEYYRKLGKEKGIVVLPTGIGKTYFSAFDAHRINGRTLFIVHRDTILKQAFDSFDDVWKGVTKGFFNAIEKDTTSQVIFASKDTLYRDGNLELFSPDAFDYIIIDEAHHSAAQTYKKIIEYFKPKFMLGMTATPDRQDRANILELFDYNLFYEMDQRDAIESGYLTGFKYYGLKDTIDYTKIKHNGRRYDVADLGRKLNIKERNQAIYDKFIDLCPDAKALGFCVTIKHAEDMAEFFRENSIAAQAIHSDTSLLSPAQRQAYIQDFRDNQLQILFTVDVFNEGADFPDIEALLFLRPTESKTIFTQQLGRGLRLSPYKEHVIVLDFIGNFKKADRIKDYLKSGGYNSGDQQKDGKGGQGGNRFGEKGFLDYPLGCEVHFDESVEELLNRLEEQNKEITNEDLIENYYAVKEAIKRKPSQSDINTNEVSKYKLSWYIKHFGSWSKFLESIGEATKASYHYPQGTHLGHIFYAIKSIGDKNLDIRLHTDTVYPESGLTTYGRKSRYVLWACMELDLIFDDRDPESSGDKTRYQNLTSKGKTLYNTLNKYVTDTDFYDFVDESKAEVSWSMLHSESYFNDFIKGIPTVERLELLRTFLDMDAVIHMLKFLFHVSQNKEIFNRTNDIYNLFFDTPFVKHYFEINGIKQDSEEGAKRRLPFILNILEAFKIIEFADRSTIKVINLPLVNILFSEDIERQNGNKEAVVNYYSGKTLPDSGGLSELRSLFGKDFLTSNYFIKSLK